MLDKSLPYLNIIMLRKEGTNIPDAVLPKGFTFSMFTQGDEYVWAEILASVGEFDNVPEALTYFQKEYLPHLEELKRRLVFIQNEEGQKVAAATIWWNYTGPRRDPSLHWIAVKPGFQGMGLGKAVVFKVMQIMKEIEGDISTYLHTQTWSWKAVGIYLQAGYEFVRTGSFADYQNDYEKAIPLLREKLKCIYYHKPSTFLNQLQ